MASYFLELPACRACLSGKNGGVSAVNEQRIEMDETVAGEKVAAGHAQQAADRNGRAKWWRRVGTKDAGFAYTDAKGRAVANAAQLERIHALVIPPAWTEVRIAPSAGSPLQVVGIDGAGRLQYHYHADFVARQQGKKFAKIAHFGEYLPALRQRTNADIAQEGLPREKALAVMVRLINELYFRVGSEASVERYRTYGITTLRNQHLEIGENGELRFGFVGKHHVAHRRVLVDAELHDLLREIKAIRGPRLFQYLDDHGRPRPITPRDINHYIKTATAPQFSAKDFRTWGGSLLAAVALAEMGPTDSEHQRRHNLVLAVEQVAERLGNTPAVCRGSYIHPVVLEKYAQGVTLKDFRQAAQRAIRRRQPDYEIEELELMKMFEGSF